MGNPGLVGVHQGMGEAGYRRDALLGEAVARHRREAGWKQETHLPVHVGTESEQNNHQFLFYTSQKPNWGGCGIIFISNSLLLIQTSQL